MAHESFEDEATAALMNRHFVNIKVDREERPDIDRIYQTAHQLMVQRPGGWPLTMFLTPVDQLPFFGGTYFPDKPKYGMIAFSDLLRRLAEIFEQEPEKIRQQASSADSGARPSFRSPPSCCRRCSALSIKAPKTRSTRRSTSACSR
jgi:uncharacterized protein YyaL (SSP411 family)